MPCYSPRMFQRIHVQSQRRGEGRLTLYAVLSSLGSAASRAARSPRALTLPLVLCAALSAACSTTTTRLGLPPLQTVKSVDLNRYTGTWYEIASFPQRFQKGCSNTTATYRLREDGEIDVVNRCTKADEDGKIDTANGRARVVDPKDPTKLEVSFFRPFWGDYWIIDLGDNYNYAVVGHPSRDYLWILSREPKMDPELYATIVRRLKDNGYETERLVRTLQKTDLASQAP